MFGEKEWKRRTITLCKDCEKDIYNYLLKGVKCPKKINDCDTWKHAHVNNYKTISVITRQFEFKSSPGWKFDNPSRRMILNYIKLEDLRDRMLTKMFTSGKMVTSL